MIVRVLISLLSLLGASATYVLVDLPSSRQRVPWNDGETATAVLDRLSVRLGVARERFVCRESNQRTLFPGARLSVELVDEGVAVSRAA